MSKDELTALIRQKIAEAGNQKRFARACNLSEQYVSDVLKGRREPGDKFLSALGLRRVVAYEPVAGCVR